MKKRIKSSLAWFLALAVLASYSFSPENLTAFAVSGESDQPTAVEQEEEKESKADPQAETAAPDEGEEAATEEQTEAGEETEADKETKADTQSEDVDETEKATDETETTTEEKADKYPAVSFSRSAGGVSVKIDAPEGALPEGADVSVTAISQSSIIDAVQDAVDDGSKVTKIKAVDITFQDKNGKEIEPEIPVSVSLHASGMKSGSEQKAFHITDDGDVEFVAEASGGNATFTAEDFSPYGVEESVEAHVVNFYEDAEDTEPYETIYCEDGDTIGELPAGPSKENATFTGWFVKDSNPPEEVTAETVVNSDMDVVAAFSGMVPVRFFSADEEGEVLVSTYEKAPGEALGSLPQNPFREGYEFIKWVKKGTTEEVTADTIVPEEGMDVEAVFREFKIYDVTVKYYYVINSQRYDFGQDTYEIEADDVPYTINPPASTKVDPDVLPSTPTYYPSEPTIQVTSDDLASADENNKITKEVEFVEYTAQYDFVYYLKNLTGTGYSEIQRTHVKGVLGSTVTPTVLEYEYADLESVEPAEITQASGQELSVYYTRKNFTLSFDSMGGSYVHATTAPYETSVSLSGMTPTRTGYTFRGWYKDSALTQPAGNSVTLTGDMTLYAKWEGRTVNYTIVYMKEHYDNNTGNSTFAFFNSRTATGTVGTEVVATDAPTLTNNVEGYEKDTEQNAASKATIAADGSTVLKVYYKLTRYTLVFNVNSSYGRISMGDETYSGSEYRVEDVVVGQDVGSVWPSSSNEVYRTDGYYFNGWDDDYHSWNQVTKVQVIDYEYFEAANANNVVTWTAQWSSTTANTTAEYWLQQPDGTYKKEDAYTQTGLNATNLSAKEIAGYSMHGGDASAPSGYEGNVEAITAVTQSNRGTYVRDDNKIGGNNLTYYEYNGHLYRARRNGNQDNRLTRYNVTFSTTTFRFYYDRAQYTITYYYGGAILKTTEPIFYEADISDSEYNYTPAPPSGKEDYEWGGWYADSDLKTPYVFNKMPGNDLPLYAKWIAPMYDVTFDLQGGEAAFATEQEVEKGTKVSSPGSPTKDHYIFDGWHTSADENSPLYDWEQPITGNTTIYAHWKQQTLGYTVHYYEEGTTDRVLADKIVSNPAFAEGDTITENALSVAGYRPDASSKSVELSFDGDNVITFYYSKKTGTTSYKVNYVLKDHPNIKVHETKTVSNVDASQVSVREMAVAVDRSYLETQTQDEDILRNTYHPLDDMQELVLSSDPDNNVLTFEYVSYKTSKVTIKYLDMDGNEIKPSVSTYESAGTPYQVVTPSINGYIYHDMVDNNGESHTSYTIDGDNDLTISIHYQKKLKITATNASKTYDGDPLVSEENGYTIDGLADGHTVTGISFRGSQTDAGSSSTIPEGAVISGPDSSNYYHITYVPGTLTVSPASVVINVEPDRWNDGPAYDGTERTIGFRYLRGSTDPNEKRGFTISNALYDDTYGTQLRDMVRNITRTEKDAGHYTIPAATIRAAITLPNDPNFSVIVNVRDGELTIPQATLTVTTGGGTKGYDGTPLTNDEASLTGLVTGETATVTATGSQTEVGSSSNTYTITWGTAKAANYTITEDLGTLEVTTNSTEVTLTAPSDSKTYDGTALTCDGTGEKKVTAEGLPEGFTVEATATGSQTDAGNSQNVVDDGYVIKNADDEDVTALFTNVTKAPGTLTVNKAPLTVATGSGSKPYDGSALTVGTATITGLVNNETATVTATGSQKEVGSSSNTYSISWGTAKAANYTITENLGTLTVTSSSVEVTLTAPSDSKTYDGTALTCDGTGEKKVTAGGLPEGFTVEATANGSQTDAGSSANVVNDGYVIKDADGNDKTSNFTNIKKVNGTLTVNKAALTITTGGGNKAYDGMPLTNSTASISGLVNNETATVTAIGTITDVGSVTNDYTINWGTTNAANYTITENKGTLTVTKNTSAIKLTAPSDEKTYDGSALTCDGTGEKKVTVEGLPEGFTVEATVTGSQKNAGESANTITTYKIKKGNQDKTASFTNVEKVAGTLTVNPKTLTITTGSATKEYDGTALTNTEDTTVTGLVTGEVAIVTTTGTITDPGSVTNSYSIQWTSANANNYTISEDLGTLKVTKSSISVTLTAATDSKTYDGTALTNSNVTATAKKTVEGHEVPVNLTAMGFTVEATASGSQTNAGNSPNVVNEGYKIKKGNKDVTSFFKSVDTENGTLTVDPKEVTVTTGSASKLYDGTVLTESTASITGLVNGQTATVTATGAQIEVGSSTNSYTINWGSTVSSNYTIKESLGTLEVTRNNNEVTLTAPSDSKTYDGTALTCDGTGTKKVTASGLPTGFTVEATATGSQTDAGGSANVVDNNYVIRNGAGEDKTANFTNVKTAKGTLTVNKAPLTITTGSASKEYDGTALTKNEASITGLVNNETATITATGSQTEIGTSQNTYTINWGTAKSSNYAVSETNLGTLEVTVNTAQITLTAPSDEKTYDGTALVCDGTGTKKVSATGLPAGFKITATASGSATNVGDAGKNVVNNGYVIKDAEGHDKTANFTNIVKVDGKLTINPAPVTISTGSASKPYDGSALTKNEASITGLVNNETATVTATGSQTEVGSSANSYSISWGTTKATNYAITENLGTLTVTSSSAEVTLTAPSDSKTYDGTALTCDGTGTKKVTASGLPSGFTVEATASGSATNVGDAGTNVVNDGYVIKNSAGQDKTSSFTNVKKVNGKLTINPASVTITTGSASKAYDGKALTKNEANITGLVNGESVTLAANGTITEVGETPNTYAISWGTTKAANYTITENLGTLTITKNNSEVKLTAPSDEKTYDGSALVCDGSGTKKVTANGLPEGFTVEAMADGSQTNAGESANVVKNGYVIKNAAGQDKTANFTNVTKVNGKLTVNPATVTITTGSDSKPYDGKALTKNEASIAGLVNNETATVTATGSQTEVGVGSNSYSIDWGDTNKNNYKVTEDLGSLTVTKNNSEVKLTAPSDEKTYDGSALVCDGTGTKKVTANGLPEGFTVVATATGSQTNAGVGTNVVKNDYIIKNAAGQDKTKNFTNVVKVNGTLTVKPKAVTVTTGGGTKGYDGTPLTKDEASITGLVSGETATVTATGSQTEVGSSPNSYTINWGSTTSSNYTIKENLGTLEVTKNNKEVTLTAPSDSKTYDGTALTCDGTGTKKVTASGLPTGFTVEATATGSQTKAGESDNVVNDGYIIKNAAGEDKTANFTNVKKAKGKLTVSKALVTITTGSASKEYDGTALTKNEVSITGLVNNETATVTATGSQTEVGSSKNSYSIDWGTTDKDNYTVKEELGTLEVTVNTAQITLTAATASKTYDGSALKNSSVSASGLPSGFTVEATATGSQTNAGSSDNVVNDGYVIKNAAGENKTSNFTNVTKVKGKLTVNPAQLTVKTGSASKPYDSTPLTEDEASITGLVNNETATVTATGSQTEVGNSPNTYSISWGSAKAVNYSITENLGTLTVTQSSVEVTLTAPSAGKTYDGTALTADGSDPNNPVKVSGLPEDFTYEASASGSATNVGDAGKNTVGSYKFFDKNGEDKTANFTNIEKVDGKLTINPASVTITTGSDSKPYDGTALTKNEASITGLVNGETAAVTATGSQTEVGFSNNSYSIEWGTTKAGNYTITENLGKLTVTTNNTEIKLTAPSAEKEYDGKALTADGSDSENPVNVTGLPDTFTYKASASGSRTDVGESANVVNNGYKFYDQNGDEKTENFTNIVKVNGKLIVNKAPVTIKTGSDSKEYDGTALTKNEASITGLVSNETATVTATGSQTEVGSSNNTYSIRWGTAKAGNYAITEELGLLEVTKCTKPITLTAPSDSKTYDGTPLTCDGKGTKKVTASDNLTEMGFTVEATASGSQMNAGQGVNSVNTSYKIFDQNGNEKTENFTNVSLVDGTLTVNPRKVRVRAQYASKVYGEADPWFTAVEENVIVDGYTLEYEVNRPGAGTDEKVGLYENAIVPYGENVQNEGNYVVEYIPADFRITKQGAFTIETTNFNGVYDGKSHSASVVPNITDGTLVEYSTDGGKTWTTTVPKIKDVGTLEVMIKATNPNYEEATATLTMKITPKEAVITTGSATKVFDGSALTNSTANITGLVGGDKATVTAVGSRTEVGTSTNGYMIDWGSTNKANYTIKENLGSLVVTPYVAPENESDPAPTPDGGTTGGGTRGGGTAAAAGAPAAPAAPAVAAPPPTVIVENPEPPTTINDGKAPVSAPTATWALLNLLCMLAAALIALLMLFRRNRKGSAKLIGLIPAVASMIAFILTENLGAEMAMTDKWTPLMAVILAVQIVLAIVIKAKGGEAAAESDEAAQ